jgi:hypothetical protein
MLFVELVKAENCWLWHSGRIDNKPELGFGCFGKLVEKEGRIRWRILVVRWWPMHCVVHFLGR